MKYNVLLPRLAYVAVIALATFAEPRIAAAGAMSRISGVLTPALHGRDFIDALRNVLLFAGWGAVWAITLAPGRAWPIILKGTGAGALLSGAAETLQLLSPARTPSILDVVTNTTGAFAGALATAVLVVLVRAGRGQRSYFGMPMVLFAVGYGGAAFTEAASPLFRQETFPGISGGLFARLAVAWRNLHLLSLGAFPIDDMLLFLPAGVFAVAALGEAGTDYKRAAIITAGAGVLLCVLGEVTHGSLGFPMDTGAVLAHALGVVAGAVVAMLWLGSFTRNVRGAARPLLLFWFYAFLLAMWALRPYFPEASLATIAHKLPLARFIPLQSYRERVDVFSAADAVVPVLQLLPLGGLLAVWPLRRRGPLSSILPGVYLVCGLEVAQVFVAGRYFDITDALIGVAALGLGYGVLRRAGYQPYGEMLSVDLSGGARARRPA